TVAGVLPPPRAKAATGLPPARAKPPSAPPPIPVKPTTMVAVVPPPPLVATMLPIRAETDPGDLRETVEREAMTIARDGGAGGSVGDSTEASIALPETAAIEEHTDLAAPPIPPLEPRDSASDIQTSMQRKLTASELMATVARESQNEIETIAREKISARNLAVGDSTSPGISADAGRRPSLREINDQAEAPTAPAPSKISVSTASDSLPPPKPDEAVAAGPTPACPQCEAPMAWVEEHLRFYCKSCRMYF
nr:hypothetical protein [Deltaproteobacteria bacterium]